MATKHPRPRDRTRLQKLPRSVARAALAELAGLLRELAPLVGEGFTEDVAAGPVRLTLTVTVGPAAGPGCGGVDGGG
jgi:hypothetical protein